jgi:hypothetical protein
MDPHEVELVGGPLDGRTHGWPDSGNLIHVAVPMAELARSWVDGEPKVEVVSIPLVVYTYRRDPALSWRFVYVRQETM